MKRLAWCLVYDFAGLVQTATSNVTFHGMLISPPVYTINDGKTIEAESRNVIIDNINGDNFRQSVPHAITRGPDMRDDTWGISLIWTDSQTPYDGFVIETGVDDLGIELQQDDRPFKLGTPLKIDPSAPPALQAVPVEANDTAFSGGTFSAYATLQVDYQ